MKRPGGISSLVEFNKSWQLTQNSNKVCDGRSVQLNEAIQASIFQGKLVSAGAARDDSNLTSSLQTFAISLWIEIMVISKRLIKKSSRMPERFAVRLLTTVTTGFILATVYWQFDDSPSGTRGRLQFSAFGITCIFYICSSKISLYLEDRNLYIRETANNSYRLSSYLIAHTLVSIPSMIILSLVYAAMTFWTVGLAGGFVSGFLFYFITVFATFWAGSSFMVFVSGLVSSVTIGFVIVASFVGNFLLFSGFYISREQMHCDSTKCFMKGVQFFEDTAFVKLPTSVKIKLLESMGNVLGTNITSSTCLVTGAQILEHRGVTDISKWNCFWILV
ncbi:ABC transporter G family member [Melia azedarach]|uniref:ABC transporter G family member n=1 Tax=Melia azedarach TaxID=155640 RepID=A0ACC1X2F2_MELAZ|nr:ABC transporter G family member [Melia azedarach]